MAILKASKEASSFRDPSGFIFTHNGEIYRQINQVYREDYQQLTSSGLYERLTQKRKLVFHDEVDLPAPEPGLAYKVIKPEQIRFLSYPYEWSFTQLKDAALLTLNIQKEALLSGMILKDASAFNIQFQDGHPILIDTLSFAAYQEGETWIAYKQFCQHFLAPLALMSKTDIRLNGLLKNYIDGIPLDLASRLLPKSTWLNFGLLSHLHLHAMAQRNISSDQASPDGSQRRGGTTKSSLIGLIENLEKTVRKLQWTPRNTDWSEYYGSTNYSESAFEEKKNIVRSLLVELQPKTLLDLGANTGVFSRLAMDIEGCYIISTDIDPGAVEQNYLEVRDAREKDILPLVIDLINPTPAIGWRNQERDSFLSRAQADVVMALALIHHLAISNNLPLRSIAQTLASMGEYAIVEFVPKEDSQVQRLLASRDDIFDEYTADGFVQAMNEVFSIEEQIPIMGTDREIFLLKRNL